ncbi:MAG: cobalt transporter, partial [Desulfohalobiaceae bacterium]
MDAAKPIASLDPRLKIVFTLAMGILVWRTGPVGLAVFVLSWLLLAAALFHGDPVWRGIARSCALFILLWAGLKFALEAIVAGQPLVWSALESVSLGSRILVVLLTGLCLARTTSARQMGRAMTGIMRPVLGARAWLPALALSLMIHFLPMTLATLRQTGQTVKVRCPGMSLHRRMVLLATASLRSLSRKTWNQTIALAARGLDRSPSWDAPLDFRLWQWVAGGLILAGATALSLY